MIMHPLALFYWLRGKYRRKRLLGIVKSHHHELFVSGRGKGTVLTTTTILGHNPNFNGLEIHGRGAVTFGDNFHSGVDCLIITQNHNYKGEALPYDSTVIVKDVVIGDNVWLGDRVIILGGAKIGEGAIIQAGSVVVKDIPPLALAGGHPAMPFAYRDKEHYEKLKAEKKFH